MEHIHIVGVLAAIMGIVLLLPLFSKRIEEELEGFLFVMGVVSVSVAGLWSWHLVLTTLEEPLAITAAVLAAGLLFKATCSKITAMTHAMVDKLGMRVVLVFLITGLGLLSSVITAVIAALILAEITSSFKLSRDIKIRIVVIGCFAIGLGAVLTPLGEPLSTIAVSKLAGEPYHAGFLFLFKLLGIWVIPAVAAMGVLAAIMVSPKHVDHTIVAHQHDSLRDVFMRALRVYIFVMGLLLLGTGISPIVDEYISNVPPDVLYWINIVSAALDNATLTAAEISTTLSEDAIRNLLLGLLISGGILIPGNIPNIICANKLKIKSKEWAALGVPLGLAMMVIVFMLLILLRTPGK
ncbi:MAG: hypothetical protein A2Y07_04600 [Planctomycetes bacterium GWF2_50_10]|nr:MAG: hypothetical protein A2Y07_04600 [Planctomycetes bacterium GWF2_50_10]